MWVKYTIYKEGFPVKIYVNKTRTSAVLFYIFGKYAKLHCDSGMDVLDFAIDFSLGMSNNSINFSNYIISLEETAIINIDEIAA